MTDSVSDKLSLESLSFIREAAIWAKLSYKEEQNESGLKLISDAQTDCQVLIVDKKDKYVLAFRGSESITDWTMNFKISKEDFHGMSYVHSGFMNQYNSVRLQILKTINQDREKPILCCGHSLGGALSTICALDLSLLTQRENVSCVTFGSPRVGDKYFRNVFATHVKKSFRICNSFDMIPHLPLRIHYKHVNKYICIKSEFSWNIFKYHSMDTYRKTIRNMFFTKYKKLNKK